MSDRKKDPLGEEYTHESYGAITITRCDSARGEPLFGSSLKHNHVMTLTVSHASARRSLNEDRHYPTKVIVKVDLSPVQFAEMITSIGRGEGVPCTLRRIGGQSIPAPPYTHKHAQFSKEFREDVKEVAERVDEALAFARDLRGKATATKGDRDKLVGMLEMLRQSIGSNLPFVLDQFHEQMSKSVHEAKGEVEAFVQHRIFESGLAAITAVPTAPAMLAIEVEPVADPNP